MTNIPSKLQNIIWLELNIRRLNKQKHNNNLYPTKEFYKMEVGNRQKNNLVQKCIFSIPFLIIKVRVAKLGSEVGSSNKD